MTEKKKSSIYLDQELMKEMQKEAVDLEVSYPSGLIEYLWNFYQENKGRD